MEKIELENNLKAVQDNLTSEIIALKASLHNEHQRYEAMYVQCHETINVIKESKLHAEEEANKEVMSLKAIIHTLKD